MSTINVTRTLTAIGDSEPIRLDPNNKTFNVSVYVDTVTGSFVGTSQVLFTLDPPDPTLNPDNWANSVFRPYGITDDTLTGRTEPIEGVRLSTSVFTSGSISLQVVQGKYSI